MAIRVKARSGETTDQLMRRFKKLCEKEGLTKDIKRKEYYEKPSEIKRRAAIRRAGPRPLLGRPGARPGSPAAAPTRPAGRSAGPRSGGGGRSGGRNA